MKPQQLAGSFEQSGVGLHSGAKVTVRVNPGQGERQFVRTDLSGQPTIAVLPNAVEPTPLATKLKNTDDVALLTVEHLLSALAGNGITSYHIEVDGPEIPLLDGSALPWAAAIANVGTIEIELGMPPNVTEPIWVRDDDAFVAALPCSETRFTYGIDFAEYVAIGNQWQSWSPRSESYLDAIAPARTFGLAEQIEALRQAGLIQGGSLDNALVCSREGWLNPPLRFENEPVRHKLLDLVGDLSLLGAIPQAHYLAYKASHRLHGQLVQKLVAAIAR